MKTMRKLELRQIIKEEISKILNENEEETLISTLEKNGFEINSNPAWIITNPKTGNSYILYNESGDYTSYKLVGSFPKGVKIMGEGVDEWLEEFLRKEK